METKDILLHHKTNPMANIYSKSAIFFFVGLFFTSISSLAQDDFFEPDPAAKVRLGFTAPTGFYRQVLIGFHNGICTDAIDAGYDAVNTFDLPCDMYFFTNNTELFIQGVGAFSQMNSYQLGVTLNVDGEISIALESFENLAGNQGIYIYDDYTNQYFDLKNGSFIMDMEAGTYNERFSLRFFQQTTLGTEITESAQNSIAYSSLHQAILIESEALQAGSSTIELFSVNGQLMKSWKMPATSGKEVSLAINGLSSGVYIVRMETSTNSFTGKIAVK